MPIDPKVASEKITSALRSGGDRGRAVVEKRYLKSDLEHFGTSVPITRKVVKSYLRDKILRSHAESSCASSKSFGIDECTSAGWQRSSS
jgi:hypothetical protein